MENARPFTMADFRDLGRPKTLGLPKGKPPAYPPTLKWTASKTLRVSGIHFDFLQEIIQNFFSKFTEELKIVEWQPAFSTWNIEYGTRPLDYRSDMDINQVHRIKGAAWRAAVKVAKTDMPLNYEDSINNGYVERKSWHHSELRIYSDPENEGDIILDFLKMQGDSVSFWYIFRPSINISQRTMSCFGCVSSIWR